MAEQEFHEATCVCCGVGVIASRREIQTGPLCCNCSARKRARIGSDTNGPEHCNACGHRLRPAP